MGCEYSKKRTSASDIMSLVKFHIPLNIYSLQHAWRIRCQRVAAQTCMKPSLFKEGIPRNCVFHMPFHSGACTQKTTNGGRISFISEYIHNHIFKCPYICILEDNVLKGKRKKKKKEKWFLSMKLQEVLGCGCRGKYYPSHLLIQKNTALSLIKTIRDCYHLDQAQNTWQHVILDNILALTADRKEGIVIDSQIPMTGYLFLHSIHWKFVYFLLIRYNLEEICFLFPLENLLSHLLPLDIFFFFEYFLFSKLTCCLGM